LNAALSSGAAFSFLSRFSALFCVLHFNFKHFSDHS